MIYHSNAVVVLVVLSMQCNVSGMRRVPGIIKRFIVQEVTQTWICDLKQILMSDKQMWKVITNMTINY